MLNYERKNIITGIGKSNKNLLFTSDTHFSQNRTLELSRRPYKTIEEMDKSILSNINQSIEDNYIDLLYHLGDFGNHELVERINCPVRLIMGNYEFKEASDEGMNPEEYAEHLKIKFGYDKVYTKPFGMRINFGRELGEKFIGLTHEPIKGYNELHQVADYILYGHIHGRQKVKHFGTDVGVDCNNFRPMTIEDVGFFLNAIDKGYYDEEVWFDDPDWKTK